MDAKPDVGAAGPRIVKPDGSVDLSGRRGFPTPAAAFYKMVGLSYVFPKSRKFGGYHQAWRGEDEAGEVDAISGCCFCLRREILEQVGPLDSDYFMYGEDLDWCYRIRQAGWAIAYVPNAEIVHFGGQSSRTMPRWKQLYEFHKAMGLFVRKHLASKHGAPALKLIELAILLRALGTVVIRTAVNIAPMLMDTALVGLGMAAGLWLRTFTGWTVPGFQSWQWASLGLLWIGGWGLGVLLSGLLRSPRSGSKAAVAATVGLATAIVGQYLVRGLNFSRIVTVLAWGFTGVSVWLWRWALGRRSGVRRQHRQRTAVVVGAGHRAEEFLSAVDRIGCPYEIAGVLSSGRSDSEENLPGDVVEGHRIVGAMGDLAAVVRSVEADDIIVALDRFEYSSLLAAGRKAGARPLRFRVVPDDFAESLAASSFTSNVSPDQLPLIDITSDQRRWWQA
jgi:hypothetical protein